MVIGAGFYNQIKGYTVDFLCFKIRGNETVLYVTYRVALFSITDEHRQILTNFPDSYMINGKVL